MTWPSRTRCAIRHHQQKYSHNHDIIEQFLSPESHFYWVGLGAAGYSPCYKVLACKNSLNFDWRTSRRNERFSEKHHPSKCHLLSLQAGSLGGCLGLARPYEYFMMPHKKTHYSRLWCCRHNMHSRSHDIIYWRDLLNPPATPYNKPRDGGWQLLAINKTLIESFRPSVCEWVLAKSHPMNFIVSPRFDLCASSSF